MPGRFRPDLRRFAPRVRVASRPHLHCRAAPGDENYKTHAAGGWRIRWQLMPGTLNTRIGSGNPSSLRTTGRYFAASGRPEIPMLWALQAAPESLPYLLRIPTTCLKFPFTTQNRQKTLGELRKYSSRPP